MGVTVMIIMGLLSMLAISSLDLDFDQLKELRERAEADQEEEDEILDTSTLGWLDVPDTETDFDIFNSDLLAQAAPEDGVETAGAEAVVASAESTVAPVSGDDFDEVADQDAAVLPDAFGTENQSYATGFAHSMANDLWPLQDHGEDAEQEQSAETAEAMDADATLLELASFNAQEDALELPYVPKKDADGNEVDPAVSVTHHDGWTAIEVDDETHELAHMMGNTFQGLQEDNILLRRAA